MPPFSLLPVFLVLTVAATPLIAVDLTVCAAASLTDALREAGPAFSAATGNRPRFNFAASGTLARQIEDGAPADVFISADEPRLDQLVQAGLLLADTRRVLLANTLVVVAGGDAPPLKTLADLKHDRFRRIAIGDPTTVPAGSYAKQHLRRLGLWASLETKLLPAASARAALAAVESGDAEAGLVYKTDALASREVALVLEVPPAEGPAIVYPAAVVTGAKHPEAAKAFLAWLARPDAQALFAKHGFLPPPPVDSPEPSAGKPSDTR